MAVYFAIQGERYEMVPLGDVTIKDIVQIQKQTGLGVGRVEELMHEIGGMAGEQIMESPDHLTAFGVQIWLARKAVDPKITYDRATDFPFAGLVIEVDAEDEPEGEPDPT